MEPIRLTTSGMCAGVVVGISETLQMLELACAPKSVGNEQIVHMVVEEIEKHPGRMPQEWEVMIAAWPCEK
jgi:Rap1a immunity proteins